MLITRDSRLTPATALLLVLTCCAACQSSGSGEAPFQEADLIAVEGLGSLSFPNSGAAAAQEPFQRGVLLLHSFEFEAAAQAFAEATSADPDFALAYWGHAMTFNHPLWKQKDRQAALEALAGLAATAAERRSKAPTAREAGYLDAVEALFAEGSKADTDRAYMEAMRDLHQAYPDDHEARAFYALSILGSVDGERDFATYMRAAATAQPVFDNNPKHPGAAHYLIHSYDDPVHAPLGLPAALEYADIAPDAAHAQHMTTHIFLALGMWDEVVTGNIRARDTQDRDLAALGREPNLCGHYSSWLQYGHLQRGEISAARDLLDRCHQSLDDGSAAGTWGYFASMRSRQIVDTEDWQLNQEWQVELPDRDDSPMWKRTALHIDLANAFAGLRLGDDGPARALLRRAGEPEREADRVQVLQLRGLVAVAEGKQELGLRTLREAAALAESLPFGFGPPPEVKPAFELLGEELLRAGDPSGASDAFRTAQSRTPGRALALGQEQATGIGF